MKTIDAEKFLSALEKMKQSVEDSDNHLITTANVAFKLTLGAVAAAAQMAMVEDKQK